MSLLPRTKKIEPEINTAAIKMLAGSIKSLVFGVFSIVYSCYFRCLTASSIMEYKRV